MTLIKSIFLIFGFAFLVAALDDYAERSHSIKVTKRVIGGSVAPENLYHWPVSLKATIENRKFISVCGGSIIKTEGKIEWILTAAHCAYIDGYVLTNPSLWHARIGIRKVKYNLEKHVLGGPMLWLKNKIQNMYYKFKTLLNLSERTNLHVKKIFLHPLYKSGNLENDIALMKVDSEIPIGSMLGVETIELPPSSIGVEWPAVQSECIVVGWGCTRVGGRPSPVAKLANMSVWDNSKCREAFDEPIGLNEKHEFCAGYHQKNYGLCSGDSGSALACLLNGNFRVAGIVSGAHSKKPGRYPAIFTRVSFFRSWIDETIRSN